MLYGAWTYRDLLGQYSYRRCTYYHGRLCSESTMSSSETHSLQLGRLLGGIIWFWGLPRSPGAWSVESMASPHSPNDDCGVVISIWRTYAVGCSRRCLASPPSEPLTRPAKVSTVCIGTSSRMPYRFTFFHADSPIMVH